MVPFNRGRSQVNNSGFYGRKMNVQDQIKELKNFNVSYDLKKWWQGCRIDQFQVQILVQLDSTWYNVPQVLTRSTRTRDLASKWRSTIDSGQPINQVLCFYRKVKLSANKISLVFTENKKSFDPEKVYEGIENPTKI